MSQVTDEDIRIIIDGCEGVTPGPWVAQGVDESDGEERGADFVVGANAQGVIAAAISFPTEHASGDFSRVVAIADHIARLSPEVVRSLLTELLELRSKAPLIDPAGGGKAVVKPLEWTKIDNANDNESEEAVTPFGGYVITADPFTYSPATAYYVDGPDWFKAQCASVPEAKAAAQADYEARILSALPATARETVIERELIDLKQSIVECRTLTDFVTVQKTVLATRLAQSWEI